jgi:hypothetical protein
MTTGEMSKKQRVITALSRREPDRAPVFVTITAGLARKMSQQLGLKYRQATSYLENRL